MTLTLDATGVGRPVVDLFMDAYQFGRLGRWPRPITITGGQTMGGRGLTVPKASLVANLEVLLQDSRLKFAVDMPLARTIRDELLTFRANVSASGRASFEAAGSGHDDLVLAVALACWRPAWRFRAKVLNLDGTVTTQ